MTHHRARFCKSHLVKALTYSPCVGIVGMRQVGKSTLLREFASCYHSFDDDSFLRRFEIEKTAILEHEAAPLALDEIQKHPPAFDAIKFSIDNKKRMGRFLVSGSVRFSSRRQIRESLTGRIVTLEMFPLGMAECHERSLNPLLKMIHKNSLAQVLKILDFHHWATADSIRHYLLTGGLPGICFRRDAEVRAELFEQHIDTLLRRDIHLVRQLRLSFAQLKEILRSVAVQEGLPVNLSLMARLAGCSLPAVKTSLEAMEGLFLIRAHAKNLFIEDPGLASHLRGGGLAPVRIDTLRAAYHELRLQHYFHARHHALMGAFSTRGGIDVPFFFEYKDGFRLAILVDAGEMPSEKSIKSVTWIKKRFSDFQAIILTNGGKGHELSRDCIAMPLSWIF